MRRSCCSASGAPRPRPARRADRRARPNARAGFTTRTSTCPAPPYPPPKGYVPFYISHYGRHGSRWHTSEKIYAEPLGILRKADSAGVLTPKGATCSAKVEVIAADARDRYGDLSPRGVAEHRGIAERMYKAYPEVFSTEDGRECFVQQPFDARAALHPEHGGLQRASQGAEPRNPDDPRIEPALHPLYEQRRRVEFPAKGIRCRGRQPAGCPARIPPV